MITEEKLGQLIALRSEVKAIKKQIERRKGMAKYQADIVKGSMSEFPYSEVHIPVEGIADPLSEKLKRKEERLELEIAEIESFIDTIEEPMMRTIIRYRYSLGMTYQEIGFEVGYEQSMIKKKIDKFLEQFKEFKI